MQADLEDARTRLAQAEEAMDGASAMALAERDVFWKAELQSKQQELQALQHTLQVLFQILITTLMLAPVCSCFIKTCHTQRKRDLIPSCWSWQELDARCRAAEGKVDQVQDNAGPGSWTQQHAISPGIAGHQHGMTANPLFGEVLSGHTLHLQLCWVISVLLIGRSFAHCSYQAPV